jgi:hypothetical protein
LQSNAAVRTSAFPECGSGDPGDQAWGSIKYLRPFPFIQTTIKFIFLTCFKHSNFFKLK